MRLVNMKAQKPPCTQYTSFCKVTHLAHITHHLVGMKATAPCPYASAHALWAAFQVLVIVAFRPQRREVPAGLAQLRQLLGARDVDDLILGALTARSQKHKCIRDQ